MLKLIEGGKFACFSSANDKATTCDIYSGANSRIEWNGNVSGDNITIKFYKERQATLGYVLNGVEQLVTDEVGWESPTTKNLGNGVLTQLFAENNAGTSAGFFSVVVDGKVLVDPTNIYSVVSTDAPASKMTVDGGDWNNGSGVPADEIQSDWSSNVTGTFTSGYGPEQAFNGDLNVNTGRAVPESTSATFNFGTIPITTSLKISVGADRGSVNGSGTLKVNGVDVKSQITTWDKAHSGFVAINWIHRIKYY